jgi:hypothetical protein
VAEGSFVRVYHEDLIKNYEPIWDDDRALATWLRLLVLADKLWPSPAELPRRLSRASLDKLVKAKLVTLQPNGRFRIRGLDAQRQRQVDAAKKGAAARWSKDDEPPADDPDDGAGDDAGGNAERNPPRNPTGNASATHARARPRSGHTLVGDSSASAHEAGTLRARGAGDGPWPVISLVERLSGRPFAFKAGSSAFETLAADVRDCGRERVERAIRDVKSEANGAPIDVAQLVFGAHNRLYPLRPTPRKSAAELERDEFDRGVQDLKQLAAQRRAQRLATEGAGSA